MLKFCHSVLEKNIKFYNKIKWIIINNFHVKKIIKGKIIYRNCPKGSKKTPNLRKGKEFIYKKGITDNTKIIN